MDSKGVDEAWLKTTSWSVARKLQRAAFGAEEAFLKREVDSESSGGRSRPRWRAIDAFAVAALEASNRGEAAQVRQRQLGG